MAGESVGATVEMLVKTVLPFIFYLFAIYYYVNKAIREEKNYKYWIILAVIFLSIPLIVYLSFYEWKMLDGLVLLAGSLVVSVITNVVQFKLRSRAENNQLTSINLNNAVKEITSDNTELLTSSKQLIERNSALQSQYDQQTQINHNLELQLRQISSSIPVINKNLERKRIVILIPIGSNNDDAMMDVRLMLDGFGKALDDFNPRVALIEIDFRFYDHNYKEDVEDVESVVREELLAGTEYFICTTSPKSKELALIFPKLLQETNKKAILLCTVASYPNITTEKNKIYRFFVRADDECEFLVKQIRANYRDLQTASIIYFNTVYGDANKDNFKKDWGSNCNDGIRLDNNRPNKIGEMIDGNISRIENKDLIFIVGTWLRVESVFNHLLNYDDKFKTTTFVVPTGFKFNPAAVKKFNKFKIITCTPKFKGEDIFVGSVVTFFAEVTLLRLVDIITSEGYSIEKFDELWATCNRPRRLDSASQFTNDTRFSLELETINFPEANQLIR